MTIVEIKPDVISEEADVLAQSRINLADRIEIEWYEHRGPGVSPGASSGVSHGSPSTPPTKVESKESEK